MADRGYPPNIARVLFGWGCRSRLPKFFFQKLANAIRGEKKMVETGNGGLGMSGFSLRFQPPGAVSAKFQASDAGVRMLMGPYGSGKTSTCLMEIVFRAARQARSKIDGIRYSKWGVIRDTYPNLRKTTIPSWFTWVPKSMGAWTGDAPATHHLKFQLPDGSIVDLLVEFIALGEHRVEDVMRGWEGTGVYINEADRLSPEVLQYVRGRVGRYPSKVHGGPIWYGVILDMNAPDTENWSYEVFVENLPDGFEFFRQPSGFDPQAENLANLPLNYYTALAQGQPDWYVRRFVRNEWGYSREGKPVFPEFNDAFHVSPVELLPVRELPLLIGFDAGKMPTAIIKQHLPNNQWRYLDELIGQHMGPTRFSELLNQLLKERYEGFDARMIRGWADPSAAYGGDGDDKSWLDTVRAKTGLRIDPAPTNNLSPRLDAVRITFTRNIDGHIPGALMSPRCKILRKGYNSGYRYRKKQIPGEITYAPEPDKNDYSHPADGDQYVNLGGGEYHEVMGRKNSRQGAMTQTQAITDDNPTGVWQKNHQLMAIVDD